MSDDPEGLTDRIVPERVMESTTHPAKRPPSGGGGGELERTAHAQTAVILTIRLGQHFKSKNYGPYEVRVQEPQETTAGGAQARQSVVLTRANGRDIMCGWMDSVQRAVELRPYPDMVSRHQSRFSAPFPLSANDYEGLIQDFGLAAKQLGLAVSLSEAGSAQEISGVIRTNHGAPGGSQMSTGLLVAIGGLILVVGLLAGLVLARALG